MAGLHSALKTLSPISIESVPSDSSGGAELDTYLRSAFSRCEELIESVPAPPPADSNLSAPASGRPRSHTTSSIASAASETSLSSARSAAPVQEHVALQKEWGRPLKLSAKDNPLGVAVWKTSGKDGRGAWFARRSVHEGVGFSRFKNALKHEFPASLEVQGGPGEGNVRGIGAEKRVERRDVPGVGMLEVYHLSAQFPGPTSPRDFVTLFLTAHEGLEEKGAERKPRSYFVLSRPCEHGECPPREGYIRGEYESIELIREVPRDGKVKMRSRASSDVERQAGIRRSQTFQPNRSEGTISAPDAESKEPEKSTRQRGKTISFATPALDKTKSAPAKEGEVAEEEEAGDGGEDDVTPVEWIMITRSDPGGSVPRWMVERGTPAGICSDAQKFLDWACKLDKGDGAEEKVGEQKEKVGVEEEKEKETEEHKPPEQDGALQTSQPEANGIMSNIAGAVGAGISAYAPNVVLDRLPGHEQDHDQPLPQSPSSTSLGSFATADSGGSSSEEGGRDDQTLRSQKSRDINSNDSTPYEKEIAKLELAKQRLDERLAKARSSEGKNVSDLTAKEAAAVTKAEERHARDTAKQEERYRREIQKIEARQQKEARKAEARRRKAEDKDERARWAREKLELQGRLDLLARELDLLKRERDELKTLVGTLQKENTSLVMSSSNTTTATSATSHSSSS